MPTYVCHVPSGALTPAQRGEIANVIAGAHSEATGAPPYFVQVAFNETAAGTRFLGGRSVDDHIWIRGDIRAGRTEAQKAALLHTIATGAAAVAGIGRDAVWVYLCELVPTDMIEYGHVLPKPGAEQAWFDALPAALRDYLSGLGDGRPFKL